MAVGIFWGIIGTFYHGRNCLNKKYDCLDCYYPLLSFLFKNDRMNNEMKYGLYQ